MDESLLTGEYSEPSGFLYCVSALGVLYMCVLYCIQNLVVLFVQLENDG
jgi:hypothetical protein